MKAATTALLALLAGGGGTAQAAPVLEAGVDIIGWHYVSREPLDGRYVLNSDQGHLPGLRLSITGASPLGPWSIEAMQAQATLTYDGFTQIGLPLTSRTALRWRHLQARLAPLPTLGLGPTQWQFSLGLGLWQMNRDIAPTAQSLPLTERLEAALFSLGLTGQWAFAPAWQARAQWQGHQAWDSRLDVNTHGLYDRLVLRPGGRGSQQWALGLTHQLAPGWRLSANRVREQWQFGPADARPLYRNGAFAGIASYPGSRHDLAGWQLRLDASF